MDIQKIIENQRQYFKTGETLNVMFRINALKLLKKSLADNLNSMLKAFKYDYNKSGFDVISTEMGLVMGELDDMIHNLKQYTKPKTIRTSIINFPSAGKIYAEPYGVVLIVSPWNYPVQLSMIPIIGAIAAGNTVILKPSALTKEVQEVIKQILSVFDEKHIAVIMGGRDENEKLFEQRYDYIFFTGSPAVARGLMAKAAQFLTPGTYELGGKSPCIIDEDASLEVAATRSSWGKFLNAGQTCVAPDFFLVHKNIKEQFIQKVTEKTEAQFYDSGRLTPDFTHIISEKHKQRIQKLIDAKKVVFGGKWDGLCLEPTIMKDVTFSDSIMQEEIFAPIMPIIEFENFNKMVETLKEREKPLALYYFGKNRKKQEYILQNLPFGGGCINETVMHVSEHSLPFGGVGNSGTGSYHGKKTFDTFSHFKSVLVKNSKIEIKLKYRPHTNTKLKLMKMVFKIK